MQPVRSYAAAPAARVILPAAPACAVPVSSVGNTRGNNVISVALGPEATPAQRPRIEESVSAPVRVSMPMPRAPVA